MVCWTNVKQANTPPRAPGGGGFGCEQFSLGSLYDDYLFKRNIWTKTNIFKDLCRYLGVRISFYRHPETDFIVSYSRQPPFDLSKEMYTSCHPAKLLLSKHKFLILSKATKTNGKLKVTKFIKPPKQMLNKWFFQEHFSIFPLLLLQAAACNFRYSNIGCCNTNQLLTFFTLNPAKQIPSSLLHPWDIRHGMFTKTAIKRMYDNLSIDSTFQPDAEYQPHQKKEKDRPTPHTPRRREPRSPPISPLTLRRKYLPSTNTRKLPPAHPPAAAAAPGAQAQHPQNNNQS